MSRISRCIDNGPMEAFWGTLKSEMYYLKTFKTYDELVTAIKQYIEYYNTKRYQKRLCCMTPIEFRNYLNSKSLNWSFYFFTVYLTGGTSEVECFFLRIERFRKVFIRYGKLDIIYFSIVTLGLIFGALFMCSRSSKSLFG